MVQDSDMSGRALSMNLQVGLTQKNFSQTLTLVGFKQLHEHHMTL